MEKKIPAIMHEFGLDPDEYTADLFGSGLIHQTYLIRKQQVPAYILQQVNHNVFRKPEDIAHNLAVLGNFLKVYAPDYPFTVPVKSSSESDYVIKDGRYFRMFHFITGTHTVDSCQESDQAYEAAFQFGRFTSVLHGLRTDMLRYTIPGFHDLAYRYKAFEKAVKEGNRDRLEKSRDTTTQLFDHSGIADQFKKICNDDKFIKRVTHHDTKISNVLLDRDNKGVCVIDLDTVMPGYFFSDVGDMIRTYVSPANEEETDLQKIYIRQDFLKAIHNGYMDNMGTLLTDTEKSAFVYAGKFMIYMQALRFYTDHLNDDVYYGASYPGHNLNRARNQLKLLDELFRLEKGGFNFY
jgi:Ser/Thr protein kinase RdoA (MazF antagonist)